MGAPIRDDLSINTIIGPSTSVSGDIDAAGFVRVDGNLRGNLSAKGRVVIGEKARLKSNITGTFVTIGGVVKGNVVAHERVVVLSTGLVLGDIITRKIQAEEGCLIQGKIVALGEKGDWNATLSAYRDTQGIQSVLSSSPAEADGRDGQG